VVAGDFQRTGVAAATAADVQRLAQEVASLTGDRQMIRIEAAAVLAGKKDEAGGQLAAALAPMAAAPEAGVRAALIRALPLGVPAELEKAVSPLGADGEAMVRLLWARREGRLAARGGEVGGAAVAALEKLSAKETDEAVKEWLASALPLAKAAATRPGN
jgi:hypothetical protein